MSLDKIGTNQPVLVILCHPQDKSPRSFGFDAVTLRQMQIDVYENLVNQGIKQMSYKRTSFAFDYTDWLELPQDDDFYFDRPPSGAKLRIHPFWDALPAASFAGYDLATYQAFVLCMATGHIRGWASSVNAGTLVLPTVEGPPKVLIEERKNVNVVSVNAHWGRRLHELCHHLGLKDLYGGGNYIADARAWDLGGKSNQMPLLSTYHLIRNKWYDHNNIRELQWGEADFEETFVIRAHDVQQDAEPGVIHAVKINIFYGLNYYVEVRQKPAPWPAELDTEADDLSVLQDAADFAAANPDQFLFDHYIPVAAPDDGCVMVLKSISAEVQATLNQRTRRITKLSEGPLQAGQKVVDAARRITISVEAKVDARLLAYRVKIKWSEVATADPNGLFNLRVRPWDSSWQTPDIWVDSELNGWDTYEEPLDSDDNPEGNGDRPWVAHQNRIYARVHNEGTIEATDVQVTFYVNTPPAIGDRGEWVPHAVRTIEKIPANSSETAVCNWAPVVGEHTCLKVVAATQTGENEVGDNGAQENVFHFDTASMSPHKPIVQTVSVQNPLDKPALIHITVRGLALGWEATVEHEWLWLPARGEQRMRVALMTDIGRDRPLALYSKERDKRSEIASEVRPTIEGGMYLWLGEGPNIDGEVEHLLPIGGIQIHARARKKVDIDLDVKGRGLSDGRLTFIGHLTPALPGVLVHVEVHGPGRVREIAHVRSEKDGSFQHSLKTGELWSEREAYRAQAFISADPIAADTESEVLVVENRKRWFIESRSSS